MPTSYFASSSLASTVKILGAVVLLVFWALFAVQKSPLMFYVYIVFPCYFWRQFLVQIIPVVTLKIQEKRAEVHYLRVLFKGGMTIAALLGMVVCSLHCILVHTS
jgi:phosphatidylinositol glycan class N